MTNVNISYRQFFGNIEYNIFGSFKNFEFSQEVILNESYERF